jgi:hypothetical protein
MKQWDASQIKVAQSDGWCPGSEPGYFTGFANRKA